MGDEELTEQQRAGLDVARRMATAGIPVFIAVPDPNAKTGYRPPAGWEQSVADPSVVDRWRPGLALCAVMGCGLDLIDIDPRHGGDVLALDGVTPRVYGVAATPSGGYHLFVASMGCGSRDKVYPGIDVKGGLPSGNSRGFAFITPTVRASAVTGEPVAYRWLQVPDMATVDPADGSGAAVAARVRSLRLDGKGMRSASGPDWWQRFLDSTEPHSVAVAERAITDKLAEVAGWTTASEVGFRQVLLRAALTLGGYVGCQYLDEDIARKRLEEAVAEVWGSPNDDDLLWIQQGLDDGACQPFRVYTAEDERRYSDAAQSVARQSEMPPVEGGDPGAGGEATWSVYAALDAGQPFDPAGDGSDQGLAKAVADRMYPALRLARDSGTWLKREGDVWVECGDDLAEWIVARLADLMPLGSKPVPKELGERTEQHWQAVRRDLFRSAAGSGRIAKKLRAVVRSDHPASVRVADLDANREVLWAGGMPWDLRRSGEVPTAAAWIDPGTPHMRSAICAPDPTCPTPRWDRFVAAVWPDPAVRAWALRVLSIALTGYADAALPILYGRERSGKTSLVEMLLTVLGTYGHAASPKLLSAQDNSHPEMIWDLKGRRLSFIDEGPKRGHDATERLKQITGGGSLTGRAMRANSVTFTPSHTLIMTTNDEPHMTDPALRARVRLIPCDAAESDVRPARLALLGNGLTAEAPGILAAMMREAAAYLADRDSAANASAPVVIAELVRTLAEGQDPIREWVENCTVAVDPGTAGRTLYRAFCQWHLDSPIYRKRAIPSETFFGKGLSELGYPASHSRNGKVRPLAILGWTGGATPIPPTPAAFLGHPEPATEVPDGPVTGGDWSGDRISANPSQVQNASSEPVFSSFGDGLTGLDNSQRTTKKYPLNDGENSPVETGNNPSPVNPSPAAGTEGGAPTHSAPSGKAAARKQVKAEQRLASIAAAAGEVITLPAVVDRDGRITPLSVEAAGAVVRAAVQRSQALTVDVETTGFPVGHADYALRSVQLGDAAAAVVFHPAEHAGVVRELLAAAPGLHAHSASADIVPLAYAGLLDAESAWERMHDTVIPAKLADPASTGADPGLKKLAPAVLGDQAVVPAADAGRDALFKAGGWLKDTKPTTPVERSGWAQVDTRCSTMLRYGASDVLDTAALARVLPWPPAEIYQRERLAQRMTARVALHGIRLDAAHVRELTGQHTAGRAEAADRVRPYGVDNPGSDLQVARTVVQLGATLPTTKTGRPSVAAGILEPLRAAGGDLGAFVGEVLDYRHHDTALGLFLEPYRILCERGDGRARPTIYTLGADTGRMTATRPNIQQLPREGGMRACLTADPGQLMIGADFSGVEIRVAAALSQDPDLIQMLIDGRDLHAEIARLVWGPDATKAHRYKAKPMVFQRIYGGGVPGIAKQHGVPQATAQAVVDALDRLTPRLSAWSAALSTGAQRGDATTFTAYSGRVIHLPREAAYAAANYAIQGSARELLVDALVRWNATRWGRCVLFPVHDELDVFVPEAEAAEASAELVRCMETTLYGVRIQAEPAEPSFAWADAA